MLAPPKSLRTLTTAGYPAKEYSAFGYMYVNEFGDHCLSRPFAIEGAAVWSLACDV